MYTRAWMLGLMIVLAPIAQARAEDAASQQKSDCKQQEEQEGKGEKTSAVICAVKAIFQSRIRRKKDTEPVEMTVGSPPMLTDDTDTPGPGNWEINLGMNVGLAGGEHRTEFPTIDINYGRGDRLQFSYEVPYVSAAQSRASADGSQHTVDVRGLGDSVIGVKYRFYDNTDTGLSFAVGPEVKFRTPGASKAISDNATSFMFPVMMTKEFEHASISANAGVEVSGGERHYFASFGVGKRLTDHVALLAEIAGTDLNSPGDKHVLLNVGLRRKLSGTQSISGALGRDIYEGDNTCGLTYISFFYQKLFGN